MVAVLALAAGGAGCQKSDPASAIKDRVAAYWGLKQAKTWPEVYDKYVDPEAKKALTKEAFLKRRFLAFDILSYEISDIHENGDKATVSVDNEANIPLKTPEGELKFFKKKVTTKDEWVRRDGTWYVVLTE
jgi:hypothetical protein